MQFKLKNKNDVRVFSVVISFFAMTGNYLLQVVMLPPVLLDQVFFISALSTVMLSIPLSYLIGTKLLDVNDLTVKLEHAVNHDNLTGACTRLSFYQRLSRLEDVPLAMVVADIDHFKQVNDKYGHQAGDDALKQFANLLQRNCRDEDVVARFGGEEFLILLHGVSIDEGMVATQRLCDCIRKKKFRVDGQDIQITASFGVAEVESIAEVDDAIHKADRAVYQAKRDGRDRVCQYDPEMDCEASPAKISQ